MAPGYAGRDELQPRGLIEAALELKQGKLTMRADVALTDGRTFAFEAKRMGANKPNVEVLELLAARCA